jgi:hypothetical protein
MVSTTFAAVALSAVLSGGATSTPAWQADYATGYAAAAAEHKPLAVFIGSGKTGYAQLVGGEIPATAGQMLAKSYVCVYVNTDTADGKSLAGQFEMPKGLVITIKGGSHMALRHTGNVPAADLVSYVNQYADKESVATTVQRGSVPAVVAAPVGVTFPTAPAAYPQAYNPFGQLPGRNCVGNR